MQELPLCKGVRSIGVHLLVYANEETEEGQRIFPLILLFLLEHVHLLHSISTIGKGDLVKGLLTMGFVLYWQIKVQGSFFGFSRRHDLDKAVLCESLDVKPSSQ